MNNKTKTFKDLVVWQKSHQLTLEIYKILLKFPSEEKYSLTSQMRRAAYSVPSNLVEGRSRKSKKELFRFLNIAKGSLEELKYFLILSADLNYIKKEDQENLESLTEEVSKILYAFTKSLSES